MGKIGPGEIALMIFIVFVLLMMWLGAWTDDDEQDYRDW